MTIEIATDQEDTISTAIKKGIITQRGGGDMAEQTPGTPQDGEHLIATPPEGAGAGLQRALAMCHEARALAEASGADSLTLDHLVIAEQALALTVQERLLAA